MYGDGHQVRRKNIQSTLNHTGGECEKGFTPEEYLKRVPTANVSDACLMRRALEILSGKWRTHIIYELCRHESCRFGELKKAVPRITNTMLSSTLKELDELGIIHREQFNEIPPHVEYSLTEKAGRCCRCSPSWPSGAISTSAEKAERLRAFSAVKGAEKPTESGGF